MCKNFIDNNIIWKISKDVVPYLEALKEMDLLVEKLINNKTSEIVWILSHSHIYTKGLSARDSELLNKYNIPVISVGRGGKFTYHGPGQKIIYPILNLRKRGKDLKLYIHNLETWIIATLKEIGLNSYQKPGFIGVWVNTNKEEKKIAAIGVRVSKWITSHGIALNVNPDLSFYKGIIPCGITDFGVTSLKNLNIHITDEELNKILKKTFKSIFL